MIISTSKCDKGVDSNYRIDKVFGDFRGNGGPDSRTLGQMLVRFRKPLSTIIFIACALLEKRAPKLYSDVLNEMRSNQSQVINRFKMVCEFGYQIIEREIKETPTTHTELSARSLRERLTPPIDYLKRCLERQGYKTIWLDKTETHQPCKEMLVTSLKETKEEWESTITNEIYPIVQKMWEEEPIKASFVEKTNKMAKAITQSTGDPDLKAKFIHDARRGVETFLVDGSETIGVTPEELPTVIGFRGAIRQVAQLQRFNEEQ